MKFSKTTSETLRAAVLAGVSVILAGSAGAYQRDYSATDTRLIMHNYAQCIVAKRPLIASRALLENAGNATILKRYPALVDGECLPKRRIAQVQMSFSGDLYRYALADALVAREFGGTRLPDYSEVDRLWQPPVPVAPRAVAGSASRAAKRRYQAALKDYQEDTAFRLLASFGECVARVDPRGAQSLLAARPASPDEARRFAALRPAFGRCLPEGQTLEFGKVALRGTVAMNLYRLAHAAKTARPKS